jgi:ribosomal protein S18 acetylase RimI-like enzyme
MELVFKKATPEHVQIIEQLADKIWRIHYPSIISMEQIEYMLKKMYSSEALLNQMELGQVFTLAYLNNKPVGYVSISTNDSKNYFLHKFYILVDVHKKGFGTQLFKYVLSQIPNAETIELTVNRQNYRAINFYFKNGFTIKEIADCDIGNGYIMNDFVMIKKCLIS